jgi:hypothetical protein
MMLKFRGRKLEGETMIPLARLAAAIDRKETKILEAKP